MNLGLRAAEIVGLKVEDVNFEAQTLHVVISKSGIEDHMPMSSDLEVELRRWVTHYARQVPGLSSQAFLFPARHAPRLRSMTTTERADVPQPGALRPDTSLSHPAVVVQKALRRINLQIEAGEGFHTLRRSAGRAFFDSMSEKGHDEALRMTAAFLHHASCQTTEVYLGLQHERIKRDVAIKGQPFLSGMVENHTVLRLARDIG